MTKKLKLEELRINNKYIKIENTSFDFMMQLDKEFKDFSEEILFLRRNIEDDHFVDFGEFSVGKLRKDFHISTDKGVQPFKTKEGNKWLIDWVIGTLNKGGYVEIYPNLILAKVEGDIKAIY